MKYFQGIRELGKIIENSKTIEKIKTNWNIDKRIENKQGITLIALVVTILFSYDEKLKFSNSKGFLLQTI